MLTKSPRTDTGAPGTRLARMPHKRGAGEPTVLIINGRAAWSDGRDGPRPRGAHAVFRTVEEIGCAVVPPTVRVFETVTGRDLADFDLVHVAAPRPSARAMLGVITEYLGGWRSAAAPADNAEPDRILRTARLSRRVRVPATVSLPANSPAASYARLATVLGEPFLGTTLGPFRTGRERLIASSAAFADATRGRYSRLLAQQYIPHRALLRVLFVGGRLVVAIGLRGSDCRVRETPHDAGQALDPGTLDPAAVRVAGLAAQTMGYDICAVLLMQHTLTRKWYVVDAAHHDIGSGPFPLLEVEAYADYLERALGAHQGSEAPVTRRRSRVRAAA